MYRRLDFKRSELEKQKTYAKDNFLGKYNRKVFMDNFHEVDDGKKERLANSLMEDENQHTDVETKEVGGNLGKHTNLLS